MNSRYTNFVLSVLLVVLVGYLLKLGESVLLPIFAAVIAVYILTTASDALGRMAALKRTSGLFRRLLVLILFNLVIAFLTGVIVLAANGISENLPSYQANLTEIIHQSTAAFGVNDFPDWERTRAMIAEKIDLQELITSTLSFAASLGGTTFMIAIYATFLIGERGSLTKKLSMSFPDSSRADRIESIIKNINQRIGKYLAAKTGVCTLLGVVSYIILWFMDVEFAALWGVLVGLFHFIPYIGIVSVVFPTVMALVQFGSSQTALTAGALLVLAQLVIGYVLEPKMIGKKVNLSPFVILAALSVWSTMWGLPGTILAVPLTSMITIIFAAFPATRPFAILLASDVSVYEET